jgi:hypothetical protein
VVLTYVIVGLVTVLLLVVSFRVLARPGPVPDLSETIPRLVETVLEASSWRHRGRRRRGRR